MTEILFKIYEQYISAAILILFKKRLNKNAPDSQVTLVVIYIVLYYILNIYTADKEYDIMI